MTFTKVVLALACLMSGTLVAQEAQVTTLMSKDLADFPGKEGLMITVVYPPGSSDPIHRHNAHAFVYVLEGTIVMQVRGGKETTLTPGQTFYEGPDDVPHHWAEREQNQTGEIRRLLGEGQGRARAGTRQLNQTCAGLWNPYP
jgi:quercetin dioxygenase-like cupin family protein